VNLAGVGAVRDVPGGGQAEITVNDSLLLKILVKTIDCTTPGVLHLAKCPDGHFHLSISKLHLRYQGKKR